MKNFLNAEQRKVIFLSSIGGALEFYDFIIFAIFALSIGKTFFPETNALSSILHAFTVFAIGYLARPLGGMIFSHFGDKHSRKTVFIISMIMMAAATFLMSILPGYQTWGFMATILFVMLRLIQGMAVGGEIPGAITFVKEHVENYPGLACGIIFTFLNLGIFLANFAYGTLNHWVSPDKAWRLAFFIGGILAIVSYFLRKSLHESKVFLEESKRWPFPLGELCKHHRACFASGFFMSMCQATLISMIYLYVASFMSLHDYSHAEISWISGINLAVFSLGCTLWGWASDYVGQRKLMVMSTLLMMPLSILFYAAIIHHQHLMLIYLVLAFVSAMYTGSFSAYLAKIFPTNIRFSGVALSYNLGFAIGGGLTPLLATYFIKISNNALTPSYLIIAGALMGMGSILFSKAKQY